MVSLFKKRPIKVKIIQNLFIYKTNSCQIGTACFTMEIEDDHTMISNMCCLGFSPEP